jgi:GT2 family glycosyltransferase
MDDLGVPKVSVVVLGYNRFAETTQHCLASLLADPDCDDWQLVVVDNGSDAPNRDAFERARERYPRMELVGLEKNRGYPGGMNAGLEKAKGECIVLVSSDVLLPVGTVGRLSAAMHANPDAGLIGPVSNYAGNEQQIFVEAGLSVADVLLAGGRFADAAGEDVSCLAAYRLDFCCVCLRRSVYEALGGFDEAFIPGYYEDFDYSLCVGNAGNRVLIAEHVFVFHEGGGTFGRVSKETKKLIKRNKAYFLSKHGARISMPHVRDANIAILDQYAQRAGSAAAAPRSRVQNRLAFAHSDQPRSFFKRRRYRHRLADVEKRLASYLPEAGNPA